jgi:hypothetical protein
LFLKRKLDVSKLGDVALAESFFVGIGEVLVA